MSSKKVTTGKEIEEVIDQYIEARDKLIKVAKSITKLYPLRIDYLTLRESKPSRQYLFITTEMRERSIEPIKEEIASIGIGYHNSTEIKLTKEPAITVDCSEEIDMGRMGCYCYDDDRFKSSFCYLLSDSYIAQVAYLAKRGTFE